jgi:polyisoprenoid-binding protein YceI
MSFSLGPDNGTLTVRTGRTGAASKAGHDLLLEVTDWKASIDDDAMSLDADAGSLRVREGTGGMQELEPDDIANIEETIDKEVLHKQAITFRSTCVTPGEAGARRVEGELTIVGTAHPVAFDVTVGEDGSVKGSTVIKQSDWGMKQYAILFGALKVADEVEIAIDAGQSR